MKERYNKCVQSSFPFSKISLVRSSYRSSKCLKMMLLKQIKFRYILLKFINKIGWKKNLPTYSIIYLAQTHLSQRYRRFPFHNQYLTSHIGAFLFLSLTLHFDLFETLLGFTLQNINELTIFYILYAILIVLLKVIAAVNNLIKKDASKFSQLLNDTVGSSLFSVFLVLTFTFGI